MNEYIVGVIISANGKIVTEQLIEAEDKDAARAKAIKECNDEGFDTYGISFCDCC